MRSCNLTHFAIAQVNAILTCAILYKKRHAILLILPWDRDDFSSVLQLISCNFTYFAMGWREHFTGLKLISCNYTHFAMTYGMAQCSEKRGFPVFYINFHTEVGIPKDHVCSQSLN